MLKRTLGLGLISLFVFGLSNFAIAQTGSYVGFGVGQGRFKDGCPAFPAANCDKSDTAFKFFSGFEFGRVFAAELGFVKLGEISGSGARFEAVGAELVGIAQWPVTRDLGLYAKAGGYFLTATARPSAPGFGLSSANEKSKDLTYGLGLKKINFARNYAARFEWQRYVDVGETSTTGQTDIDHIGASLIYQF